MLFVYRTSGSVVGQACVRSWLAPEVIPARPICPLVLLAWLACGKAGATPEWSLAPAGGHS